MDKETDRQTDRQNLFMVNIQTGLEKNQSIFTSEIFYFKMVC